MSFCHPCSQSERGIKNVNFIYQAGKLAFLLNIVHICVHGKQEGPVGL